MDFSRKFRLAWAGCLIGLMSIPVIAAAQVELPLGGYVRAGRCMPVKVSGSVRQIVADGAVPTSISSGFTGIVPLLILTDAPGTLRAESTEVKLRPLLPDQRLVGVAGEDSTTASLIFPERTIITVPLDRSVPLPGPVIAWETLDAVILDSAPDNVGELLAGGITVAVRSTQKPDERWPWQRLSEAWVVRADLAGPAGAVGGEAAYLPTQAWSPGRSDGLRRQIVLAGVLVLLLLMSVMLIRGNRAILVMIGIALLCGGSIEIWRRAQPAFAAAGGLIEIRSPGLVQYDQWVYVAAGTSAVSESIHSLRPIVASISHASLIGLNVDCDKDGGVGWRFTLPPHARVAMVDRRVTPARAPPASQTPITSPLYELARQAYLSPGATILGQMPDSDWPTVVIDRP